MRKDYVNTKIKLGLNPNTLNQIICIALRVKTLKI